MSTSRLLILIAGLTTLIVTGKVMYQNLAAQYHGVRPAADHGGGSAASALGRLDRLEADLAALRTELARTSELHQDVLRLQQEVAELGTHLTRRRPPTPVVSAMIQETALDDVPPPEPGQSEDYAHTSAVETAFLNDPIDPQWSRVTGDLVTRFFEEDVERDARLRSVDCRSRYCRVVTAHEDGMTANEMAMEFAMHVADALPDAEYHYEQQDDGHTEIVMYLTRAGQALPSDR